MKEEIKELLDKLKDRNWYDELDLTGTRWIELRWEETHLLLDYITNLQEERDKFRLRCYKALKLIRDNYGLLDKYGIDMIDDILNGEDTKESEVK